MKCTGSIQNRKRVHEDSSKQTLCSITKYDVSLNLTIWTVQEKYINSTWTVTLLVKGQFQKDMIFYIWYAIFGICELNGSFHSKTSLDY